MFAKLNAALLGVLVLYMGAVVGCASEPTPSPAPRSTPSRAAILATPEPSLTTQSGGTPSSSAPYILYDDKSAPFTVQYPRDWQIREEPENISFRAPDETAALQIILYEYLEGAPRNIAAKDVLNNFAQNFTLGRGLRLTQQVTNADGSVGATVEFIDGSTRPQQGLVRVLLAKNRHFHFIVLFSANRDQFTRYKPVATMVVESFRER